MMTVIEAPLESSTRNGDVLLDIDQGFEMRLAQATVGMVKTKQSAARYSAAGIHLSAPRRLSTWRQMNSTRLMQATQKLSRVHSRHDPFETFILFAIGKEVPDERVIVPTRNNDADGGSRLEWVRRHTFDFRTQCLPGNPAGLQAFIGSGEATLQDLFSPAP